MAIKIIRHLFSTGLCMVVAGCMADVANPDGSADLGTAESALGSSLTIGSSCDATETAAITTAYNYLSNRAYSDGNVDLGYCANEAFLLTNPSGMTGRKAAERLKTVTTTTIGCQNISTNTAKGTGTPDSIVVSHAAAHGTRTTRQLAGDLAHAIMLNHGFSEAALPNDDYYNSIPMAIDRCIANYWPTQMATSKYGAYSLFVDNVLTKQGAWGEYYRFKAEDACQADKAAYPNRKVQCFWFGVSIGYELYRDRIRSAYEPKFTRQQALDNCQSQRDAYPSTKVECFYNQKPLGYELYFNGSRVGHQPKWSRAQAVANCQSNKTTYPSTKVECYFEGEQVGYQLLFDGRRAGFEPSWDLAAATSHCASMKSAYEPGGTIVDCLFDGYEIPNRKPPEENDGLAREQVRPFLTITSDCNATEKSLVTRAYDYMNNRVNVDGNLELGYCANEAFLLTNPRGYTGRQAAELFKSVVNTTISCRDISARGIAAEPDVGARDAVLVNHNDLAAAWTVRDVAGFIAHEIMHNRGLQETNVPDYDYRHSVPAAIGACVGAWWPFFLLPPQYNGYTLFWDNAVVGQQTTWTKADAADNCQWNKTTYPSKKVQCFYNGVSIGYELYRDGVRAGYEPKFTNQQALDNCQSQRDAYPSVKVECFYDQKPLGYELYFDGSRVGYQPKWSKAQAVTNCQGNKNNYPSTKVECYFAGEQVGYQLFFDGRRAGYEPSWDLATATSHCASMKTMYQPGTFVDCLFDGLEIPTRKAAE